MLNASNMWMFLGCLSSYCGLVCVYLIIFDVLFDSNFTWLFNKRQSIEERFCQKSTSIYRKRKYFSKTILKCLIFLKKKKKSFSTFSFSIAFELVSIECYFYFYVWSKETEKSYTNAKESVLKWAWREVWTTGITAQLKGQPVWKQRQWSKMLAQ